MEKITDYQILTERGFIALERDVKDAIAKGWQPLGGVSSVTIEDVDPITKATSTVVSYAQAMVKNRA